VPYSGQPGNPIVSGVPPVELEKNTLKNYEFIFTRFQEAFGDRQIKSITTDEVTPFLTGLSTAAKPATKRHRYSSLRRWLIV
jgi:site-specific recombinase XerD